MSIAWPLAKLEARRKSRRLSHRLDVWSEVLPLAVAAARCRKCGKVAIVVNDPSVLMPEQGSVFTGSCSG